MGRVEAMIERLPFLYRDGDLVAGLLGVAGLQADILAENSQAVQRAHQFNATPELAEAAALAAVLDIAPEPWQALTDYRAWVHALRDARLRYGAVTVQALTHFIAGYTTGYRRAGRADAVPPISADPDDWRRQPPPLTAEAEAPVRQPDLLDRPTLIESPPRRVVQRVPPVGGLEPLHAWQAINRGLDEVPASLLYVGLPTGPEPVPVLINVTTGQAVVYTGTVPPGARLWLRPTVDGAVTAELDGEAVTDQVYSVASVVPGQAWRADEAVRPAEALRLARGANDLWWLPVAHYDRPSLDRALLALADLTMRQGRWDQTGFDRSLFYQEPALRLYVGWMESQPARYQVRLPGHRLLRRATSEGGLPAALDQRAQLRDALAAGVTKLAAAGVSGEVVYAVADDVQRQQDRLRLVLPRTHREVGPTGADRLLDAGGLFDVTPFEGSTYR